MGLVNCKECGKEISTKAPACPHCGHKPYKPGGCMIVFLVVALGWFVIASVADYTPSSGYSPPPKQPAPFDPDATARGLCMLQIKHLLHDPESAEFESSATTEVRQDGEIWTVFRPVHAKNAFNAMRRTTFECRYRLSGREFHLVSIRELK